MRRNRLFRVKWLNWMVPLSLALAVVCFIGCEDDVSPIKVSPSMASMQTGQSIDFSASGGSDYQWNLKYENTGILSTRSGPTVRFTSTYAGVGSTIDQVLTVVGKATTANGESQASCEVHITQTPIGGTAVAPISQTTTPAGHYVYNTNVSVFTNPFTQVVTTNYTVTTNWVAFAGPAGKGAGGDAESSEALAKVPEKTVATERDPPKMRKVAYS